MKKKILLVLFILFVKSMSTFAHDLWHIQESPVMEKLFSVHFVNASTGWIVGSNGTILFTQNSGKTWDRQITDQVYDLLSVYFIDESTGWIAGSHGKILKTSNGGINWIELDVGIVDTSFFEVFFY